MTTLILFHWEPCGACIAFMPTWDEKIGKSEIPSIKVEVGDETIQQIREKNPTNHLKDDDLNEIIQFKKTINGYPTIAKWDGTNVIEYMGKRDPQLIIKWAKEPTVNGGKKRKRRIKTQFRKKGGKRTKKNCWWKLF